MDRKSNLDILYTAPPMENSLAIFESIPRPCYLYQLLTPQDIATLNYIAKNKKLASQPAEKLKLIKEVMEKRGFKRLAGGTNRIAYKYMEDQRFVVKVAYDHVGLGDNISELYNQNILKPFCTKVFEVSPCGTVGLFERVVPITNREQFAQISGDVFDIIVNRFVGKYILADFGTKFFLNWGVRKNAHPVILDFPYVYELDGAKLYCNRPDLNTESGFCGGEIDYDDGFNTLRCTKCGKTFLASELKLAAENKSNDIIIDKEDVDMIINVYRGDDLIQSTDTSKETATYKKDKFGRRKETPLEYRTRKRHKDFKVNFDVDIIKDESSDEVKPHYVEQTTPQEKPTINPYHPTDFNMRMTLDNIPNVDDMYKDLKVRTVTRKGKVYENGLDMESDDYAKRKHESVSQTAATRVETTLDIVAKSIRQTPEENLDTNEEDQVTQEAKELEDVDVEQTQNIYFSSDKQEGEQKDEEDKQPVQNNISELLGQQFNSDDDHSDCPIEIETEPRGSDLPKKQFNDEKVDPAYY